MSSVELRLAGRGGRAAYGQSRDATIELDQHSPKVRLTLKRLERTLVPFGFFRSHRAFLVNLRRARRVVTWSRHAYSLILGLTAVLPCIEHTSDWQDEDILTLAETDAVERGSTPAGDDEHARCPSAIPPPPKNRRSPPKGPTSPSKVAAKGLRNVERDPSLISRG